ncbi:MAG: hypothetical protein JWO08_3228 [Verrucomicrobiaceae bacterium]|nr:hypothetical protein [Verrucomicrobiaceae bacterium]
MKVHFAVFLALSLGVCCLSAIVRAEDMPPPAVPAFDPDLPQPFDASAILPMLKNPPFNRVVDYTDNLLLTGVAYLDGKPMATLLDRNTNKRYVVSEVPNEQGWRLAEANVSNELHGTEIKLQVGVETVTIRYSDSQLNSVPKNPRAVAPSVNRGQASSPRTNSSGHISTSAYLNPADQEYYRKGMSKDVRDKFRDVMRSHEDKMTKMTDDQRASYTQKIFSKYKAQDKGTSSAPSPKKAKLR